jgi:fermentation-respiration switch protein FrsA (DUF1100 family)
LKTVLIIAAVLIVLWFLAALVLFNIACRRARSKPPAVSTDDTTGKAWAVYADIIRAGADWFRAQNYETLELKSFDGLRLKAYFLPADTPSPRGVLIIFHGYRSTPLRDMGASVRYYHSLGFHVILPFQRACGDSEGTYMTFGARERRDVKSWADYAAERFGGGLPIVLAGISLGCASVLMSLGLELPANVRGAVADCGYSSIYEELKSVLKSKFHLPPEPLLGTVNIWCRLLGGFDIHESPIPEIMRRNKIPVLFIHGEADDFVPTRFSRENFEACAAPKELFTVPGAQHALSYMVDTQGYHRALESFLDKYIQQ